MATSKGELKRHPDDFFDVGTEFFEAIEVRHAADEEYFVRKGRWNKREKPNK